MTELFLRISQIVPQCHGWCSVEKAHALAATVLALRPEVSCEVGVFGGKSLLPIAMAHREIGKGIVWAIDPWSADASVKGMTGKDAVWWGRECDHEAIYQDFIRKVETTGVANFITIKRAKSDDVEPPKNIGLLSLDGNHGEQAVRDADRYCPRVKVGGCVSLDDLDWSQGFVRKAEKRILEIGFVELYKLGTGAMFQRVK